MTNDSSSPNALRYQHEALSVQKTFKTKAVPKMLVRPNIINLSVEFESRIRKWKQLRFGVSDSRVAPRRSTSQDPHRINGCPSATSSPIRLPLESIPIGCRTSPMARRNFNLEFNSSNDQGENSERGEHYDVEKQFQKIQANSGKLILYGHFQDCRWEDFQLICDLGNGSCGHVAKYKYQDIPMAVKIMPRTNVLEENKRIMMDLDVVTKTGDCPHIVKCYGYFITQINVRVCMEVMATCLDKLMKDRLKNKPFRQDVVGKVVVSVLDALSYLKNKHKVIHRDVKPSNILMNYEGNIKLCDFGISGFLVESLAHTTQAGCPPYMAPERLSPEAFKTNYDVRSDVWSLGITAVELATGKFPYTTASEFDCLAAIIEHDPPQLKIEDGFAPDLSDFITYILNKNVNDRPNYPQILQHPYIARTRKEVTDVGSWLESVMHDDEDMDDD